MSHRGGPMAIMLIPYTYITDSIDCLIAPPLRSVSDWLITRNSHAYTIHIDIVYRYIYSVYIVCTRALEALAEVLPTQQGQTTNGPNDSSETRNPTRKRERKLFYCSSFVLFYCSCCCCFAALLKFCTCHREWKCDS